MAPAPALPAISAHPPSENKMLSLAVEALAEERSAHTMIELALVRELARAKPQESEVLAIQDRERARLARDLHDGLGQRLVGIVMLMEAHIAQQEQAGQAAQVQAVREIRDLQYTAIQEARDLAHGLTPMVESQNLCQALQALASRTKAYFGVECTTSCPPALPLESWVATHLYHIAQEAVSNAVRHGQAAHVKLNLSRRGQRWRLHLTDDGTGIQDQVPKHDSMGLRSMAYRAATIGGRLKVHRGKGIGERPGTVVCCCFP